MRRLRALLSPLAALLAVVVVVQTTDLVACADEGGAAEHGETPADVLADGGHPVPAPGDRHGHDEGTFADCLCHVVFAPTTVVPEVGVRPAGESAPFAALAETPTEAEPEGLDHVPLA